jgi:hypothetical protein
MRTVQAAAFSMLLGITGLLGCGAPEEGPLESEDTLIVEAAAVCNNKDRTNVADQWLRLRDPANGLNCRFGPSTGCGVRAVIKLPLVDSAFILDKKTGNNACYDVGTQRFCSTKWYFVKNPLNASDDARCWVSAAGLVPGP